MGKNNNIKRAKRLKEAKRKREQDALISSGNGPGAMEIIKRSLLHGAVAIQNKSKIKYSELLRSFVSPLIENNDTIDTIKNKYAFGAIVWNAATMREKSEDAFLQTKEEITPLLSGPLKLDFLFDELVRLKQEQFAEYKNLIVDFEIKPIRGLDYELSVATSPMNE